MSDDDPFASLSPDDPGPSGLPGVMGSDSRPSGIPGGAIALVVVLLLAFGGAVLGWLALRSGSEGDVGPSAAPIAATPEEPAASEDPAAAAPAPIVGGSRSEEPAAEAPAQAPAQRRPARRARDLLSPAGLAAALRVVRREAGGKAAFLAVRVDRERVSFTGRGAGGKLTIVMVPREGEPNVVRTGGAAPSFVAPLSRLDPRAPARILAATGRAKAVDYFAASPSPIDGTVNWSVFFRSGKPQFLSAGADGRNPRAPGG